MIALPERTEPGSTERAAAAWDEYDLPAAQRWVQQEIMETLGSADLILYLSEYTWEQPGGWQSADDHWYARLRATPVPILPLLTVAGRGDMDDAGPGDQLPPANDFLHRHLGVQPILLSCPQNGHGEASPEPEAENAALHELVDRILEVRPRLAVPLAQEVPACRQLIARRVVRAGAWMTALLGMEPLPLLDLPLTVLVQWKMALQLAAIHGRPGVEALSREMAGTIGLNLLVRTLAQQAVKFLPLFGWLLSAGLNFVSTWVLGQALLSVYGEDRDKQVRAKLVGWSKRARAGVRVPHAPFKPGRRKQKEG